MLFSGAFWAFILPFYDPQRNTSWVNPRLTYSFIFCCQCVSGRNSWNPAIWLVPWAGGTISSAPESMENLKWNHFTPAQRNVGFFLLRWLTTVFLRHNCARWEILSDAIFFARAILDAIIEKKLKTPLRFWLVEIARGVLLTSFIMNGRSLEAVSERYRYKISVKPWQKPREVVVKILMFIARAILRYFSARLSCTHAQFCSRRRSQKNRKSTFWPQSTRKLTV